MEATIAKLDKVVKTYNKHHVLNEISMSINKGELLGLMVLVVLVKQQQ